MRSAVWLQKEDPFFLVLMPSSLILKGARTDHNDHSSNAPFAMPGDRWTLRSGQDRSDQPALHRLLRTTCRLLVSHVLSQLPTSPPPRPPSRRASSSPAPLQNSTNDGGHIFRRQRSWNLDGKEGGREQLEKEEEQWQQPLVGLFSSVPPLNSSLRPFLRENSLPRRSRLARPRARAHMESWKGGTRARHISAKLRIEGADGRTRRKRGRASEGKSRD